MFFSHSGLRIFTYVQSDMDKASERSEQWMESDDKILLEIRKDDKKINNKFDHLETSVRQLKRGSKGLKDQNAHLTIQVNELKLSVSN